MGEEADGKLFYVATISPGSLDMDDSSVQTFVHDSGQHSDWSGIWGGSDDDDIKKKKGGGGGGGGLPTKEKKDLEKDEKSVVRGNQRYTLRYRNLQPGTTYKVTIATTYDSKEVAENYVEFTTRPVAPTGTYAYVLEYEVS